MKARMSREEYYLEVLEAVRKRSTCDRGMSGAILVKDGRIIATGYVGAPAGMSHCDEAGHVIEFRSSEESGRSPRFGVESKHCIRTVHAELNAILQCAFFGVKAQGATMYCAMTPCFECAKAIVNVGIKEVIAVHPYQAQDRTIALFGHRKIPLTILSREGLY